jgi:CrcB protein
MMRLLLVCVGGALGSGARYLLAGASLRLFGPAFPYGTLIVNAAGSFLIAFIMHVSLTTALVSPTLRVFITTGVLGGFTTYSTYSYETLRYLEEGAHALAAVNMAATVLGCLVASVLGLVLGRALAGP